MRYPLPYAFARTHQLLLGDDGAALTLWLSPSSDKGALSEVVRHCASATLSVAHEDAPALVQRISQPIRRNTGRANPARRRWCLRSSPRPTCRA